jgi:type III pantothenate kinase
MANLIIDIGNTNLKINIFETTVSKRFVFSNNEFFFDDKLMSELTAINIIRCIISQVGEISDISFLAFIESTYVPLHFRYDCKLPIINEYKTPHTLGLDRLAAVYGAKILFPQHNILVIDVGTAITYDLITADSRYLGGNISPGIKLRYKALHDYTKKLPLIENLNELNYHTTLGTSTIEAITFGVENGFFVEVAAMMTTMTEKYNDLIIIFTGGDASYFQQMCSDKVIICQDLVAIGLNDVLERNFSISD